MIRLEKSHEGEKRIANPVCLEIFAVRGTNGHATRISKPSLSTIATMTRRPSPRCPHAQCPQIVAWTTFKPFNPFFAATTEHATQIERLKEAEHNTENTYEIKDNNRSQGNPQRSLAPAISLCISAYNKRNPNALERTAHLSICHCLLFSFVINK